MGADTYFKVTCGSCDGHISYPASSSGATVVCPHCGKSLFLPYQSPAPEILEATVVNADVPATFTRPLPPSRIYPLSTGPNPKSGNVGKTIGIVASVITVLALLAVKMVPLLQLGGGARTDNVGQRASVSPTPSPVVPPEQQQLAPLASAPVDYQPATMQQTQPQPSYSWNTSENDAMLNGNMTVAYNWIMRNPNLRSLATAYQPGTVAKTPYLYYGHVAAFNGVVAVVQDFSPGSDFGQSLGGRNASDIVMECNDGTAVEMFCMKASGYIAVGHAVNLYGYPVGVTEVKIPRRWNFYPPNSDWQ